MRAARTNGVSQYMIPKALSPYPMISFHDEGFFAFPGQHSG
jgi:hypothetical protein